MQPSSYLDSRAELLVDVSEEVERSKGAYIKRWRELLEDPDQRSDLLIEDCVGYLQELRAETAGLEAAQIFAENLLDYADMSWEEIHDVDPAARGDEWWTARRMVATICQAQALAEISGVNLLEIGQQMGDLTRSASGMSKDQKKTAATEGTTKKLVTDKAKARKATVTTEG